METFYQSIVKDSSNNFRFRSDYEGWKRTYYPQHNLYFNTLCFRSDYEGWKHLATQFWNRGCHASVLEVTMRDGNLRTIPIDSGVQ